MSIGSLCNREVVIAESSMPVNEAARLMRQYHVGDLVVVEEVRGRRKPVGLLTDRDIVIEVVARDQAAESLRVGDIMSATISSVSENAGVFEAMRYMREKGFRRMPVLDKDGWLTGIITLDDLLGLLAEEMGELSGLIRQEQRQEADVRP